MKIQETQSVQLPLLGTVDTLEIRVNSFPLFPSSIEVFWKVSGETTSKEGVITLPQDIIDVWGTDDTVVENYVLQQLGLVKEVEPTLTEEVVEEPIIETPEEEIVEPTPTEETPPTE
jgi:hypothetical protein